MELDNLGEFVTIEELEKAGANKLELEIVKNRAKVIFENEGKFVFRTKEVKEIFQNPYDPPPIKTGISVILDEKVHNWYLHQLNKGRTYDHFFIESLRLGYRLKRCFIPKYEVPKEFHSFINMYGEASFNKHATYGSMVNFLYQQIAQKR